MRVFQIIKKVFESSAGFIASVVQAGLSMQNRFSLVASETHPAVSSSATQHSATINQNPAVASSLIGATGSASATVNTAPSTAPSLRDVAATTTQVNPAPSVAQRLSAVDPTSFQVKPAPLTSLLGASGTAVNQAVNPAMTSTARISEFHVDALPAGNVVQVVYSLTRHVGGNAAANLGPQNWTNPANAVSGTNGIHDGTNATSAGNLTAAQDFNLEVTYADSVSKGDLTITAATLTVYAQVTGDATGLQSTVTISYDVGAGYVVLETITGNFASLSTPRSYDMTSVLTTWTKYDALKVKVRHQTIIAAVAVAGAVDAAEIDVVANKTDAL